MAAIYYRERPCGYRQFYAAISPLADVGIDDRGLRLNLAIRG
jgi:hypothetical protein